jgi:hypothetical protein
MAHLMFPIIVLGEHVADFTSVSVIRGTDSIYISIPWHASWVFGTCQSRPVIVLSYWVTDITFVVGIVDTISRCVSVLRW